MEIITCTAAYKGTNNNLVITKSLDKNHDSSNIFFGYFINDEDLKYFKQCDELICIFKIKIKNHESINN